MVETIEKLKENYLEEYVQQRVQLVFSQADDHRQLSPISRS
jgi:hypothetical protein